MYVVCCCRQGRCNVGWSSCHPRKRILPFWPRLTEGGLWSQCCVSECISAAHSAESPLAPIEARNSSRRRASLHSHTARRGGSFGRYNSICYKTISPSFDKDIHARNRNRILLRRAHTVHDYPPCHPHWLNDKESPTRRTRVWSLVAPFTVPAALWMPTTRPTSSRFKINESRPKDTRLHHLRMESYFATLGHARRLKDVMFFLAAWFLLSDGYTTITSTAILFAKTTLGIGPAGLAVIGILSTSSGIIGAILWPRVLTPRLKFLHNSLHEKKLIIFILSLSLMIPLYGLLGFLPLFQNLRFGGLVHKNEIFGVALVFGFLYGGVPGCTFISQNSFRGGWKRICLHCMR